MTSRATRIRSIFKNFAKLDSAKIWDGTDRNLNFAQFSRKRGELRALKIGIKRAFRRLKRPNVNRPIHDEPKINVNNITRQVALGTRQSCRQVKLGSLGVNLEKTEIFKQKIMTPTGRDEKPAFSIKKCNVSRVSVFQKRQRKQSFLTTVKNSRHNCCPKSRQN